MRRFYRTKYGGPEVLRAEEVAIPHPAAGELLIRVAYAGVNRTDSGFLTGIPKFARIFLGFPKPKAKVLGCEFSGKVVAVGEGVRRFRVGDRVFGFDDARFGGFADYLCLPEKTTVTQLPASVDYKTGAMLGEGSHYALCDLRAARVGSGSRVLVYGASGAIGSAAVQLARALGASVTAVCGTQATERVKTLGAQQVLDYQNGELDQHHEQYDLFFDAVGKLSWSASRRFLSPKGIYISTELGPGNENPFLALTAPFRRGQKLLFPIPVNRIEDFEWFAELAGKGEFTPLFDRIYPFEQLPEALSYVLSGQKLGNVLLEVSGDQLDA